MYSKIKIQNINFNVVIKMDSGKPIIFEGKWWLPSNNQKESGILRIIKDKEIKLELDYFINIKKGVKNNPLENFEIILGETTDGEKITLLNCWAAEFFGKFFNIEFVFIGEHFNNLKDIKFKSIEFAYTYLNEWAYPYWYKQSIYYKKNKVNKERITYIKKEPIKIFLDIPDNKINLTFSFNLINSSDSSNKSYKKRKTILLAESDELRTFNEWWDIITIIRNFLILGTFKPIYSSILKAKINKRKKVDIYRTINVNMNLSDLRSNDMLFTLKDIEKDIEKYLKNWFIKSSKLKDIVTGLFIVLNNPEMGLENQLIHLSGLVEWYFRDNRDLLIMNRDEYDDLRANIIDLIKGHINLDPSLPKCFVENNIVYKYGYQKNFRTVLEELVNQVVDIFQLNKGFNKYYCHKTVITRNYFVHKDEQLKDKVAKGKKLNDIVRFLEMVLIINILIDIEFGQEIVKKIFNRYCEFNSVYRSITRSMKK